MAQVLVHGTAYELPESFTLKEMRIVERYCHGEAGGGFEVSKVCAAIHVAIMRAKPELSYEEIETVVDDLPAEDLDKIFTDIAAGQSPPAQESSESSSASSDSSPSDLLTTSDVDPENETQENSGSLDLVGFRSFHNKSAT